jgi:hypothetical protein
VKNETIESIWFGAAVAAVVAACGACIAYAVKPAALALAGANDSIAAEATISLFVAAELTLVVACALVVTRKLRPIIAERVREGVPFAAHGRFWRTASAALGVGVALPFVCAVLVAKLADLGAAGSPALSLALAAAVPACAWGLGALRALSTARAYDPTNPFDAEGEVDFELFKRTCEMPRVRSSMASLSEIPAMPSGATIAQRGQRFQLGWAESYFGIWDSWAPTEPARRFAQDPIGWNRAWIEFSRLEPNAAVRARGAWPSA